MPESVVSPRRKWLLWALTGSVVLAAGSAIVFDVTRRAASMRPATARAAAVLAARPNTSVTAVVRLQGPEAGTYLAELLESVGETTYRETPTLIHVALSADIRVVMGSRGDIRPGAIVQVAGTIDGQHTLHASRMVILSGYVRLVSG